MVLLEHINILELMAGMFMMQAYAKNKQKVHIHLRVDNTSALSYVIKTGHTIFQTGRSGFSNVEQVSPMVDNPLSITPSRVGQPVADQDLRQEPTMAKWKLHKNVYNRICARLGLCKVNLFATSLNHQLDKHMSCRLDLVAMMTNAFHISWVGMLFPLLPDRSRR